MILKSGFVCVLWTFSQQGSEEHTTIVRTRILLGTLCLETWNEKEEGLFFTIPCPSLCIGFWVLCNTCGRSWILLYCRFIDHYIWILLAQHEQIGRNHSVLEHNHSMCLIKSVLESFEVRNVELTTNCRKVLVSWTHVCLVKKAWEVFPARTAFGWWEHLEKPPTPCDMKAHIHTHSPHEIWEWCLFLCSWYNDAHVWSPAQTLTASKLQK